MENNRLVIEANALNVHLTFVPRPPLALKLVLITLCMLAIVLPMVLLAYSKEREQGLIFLGALVFYGVIYLMLGKYTLWNLLGEERLIVSTKAVNYQHHFGFFNAPWKAEKFDNIFVIFNKTQEINKQNYGRIGFVAEDENGIPFYLYSTSINICEEKANEAINTINELFRQEQLTKFGVIHEN
ncbi:hypothetical protein [Pontibacter mangrovi]|uniref:Uncharacterized protein n=1 Tax=Pontibacter mangrovi TaxID=2589816 RepID=A0A501WG10_9BACT|nr:hypothetical protein [Pontibacter mangrovi]TPE44476.1 hypothetical protein FJM65_10060 [Pontibacter mangrovi]